MVTRYVKLKGKTYPMKLCQEAVLLMAMETNLSAEEVPALAHVSQWPLKQMLLLILYSIQVACEQTGTLFDLELKDVRHALSEDEEFQADIKKIGDASIPVAKESKKKDTTVAQTPERKRPPR